MAQPYPLHLISTLEQLRETMLDMARTERIDFDPMLTQIDNALEPYQQEPR
jgi:hypothetical protein